MGRTGVTFSCPDTNMTGQREQRISTGVETQKDPEDSPVQVWLE